MVGGGAEVPLATQGGLVSATRAESLARSVGRSVEHRGSDLVYHTRDVTLVALGAPGSRPGMYWQVDGVDNPSISVPKGATVRVVFADGDPGYAHGLEVTTAAPPYSLMAMMEGSIVAPGAFIMPLPPPAGGLWYAVTTTFQAPAPGTYFLICPVPDHAAQGMWAKFVVRS